MTNDVNEQLNADVDVGCFLSGGMNSSLITDTSKTKKNKLKTFTIGFENLYDRSTMYKKIAEFLKTDHYEHYAGGGLKIIPELPYVDRHFEFITNSNNTSTLNFQEKMRLSLEI